MLWAAYYPAVLIVTHDLEEALRKFAALKYSILKSLWEENA